MRKHSKNINLYLMDGEPGGRIKCTLANWTGVAYKIPRTELESCKDRKDLLQSGIYFLFGISEQTGENLVYIGQAGIRKNGEGILCRLQEHKRNPQKEYWTEAVVFTTSNNSFGPTEISYLENKFTKIALAAKRYIVKNGNEPSRGNITEEKESELEEFIEYSKLVMGIFGYKIFEPLQNSNARKMLDGDYDNKIERVLYIKRKNRSDNKVLTAKGIQTSEGFVVFKGSQLRSELSSSFPDGIRAARERAVIDGNGVLQEDMLFKSPSYAASFVTGSSVNGLLEWKTSEGKSLRDVETGNEQNKNDIS